MKFALVTLGVGLAGTLLASNLQSGTVISANVPATVVVDPETTGSVVAEAERDTGAIRLIDLKSGASCKTVRPPASDELSAAPLGPDCAGSPSLARIAFWRSTPTGSLIMADSGGRRVLEFVPGDGVMFESIYPANELITIVPARG